MPNSRTDFFIILFYVCVYLHACLSTMCVASAWGGQERASDALGLEV